MDKKSKKFAIFLILAYITTYRKVDEEEESMFEILASAATGFGFNVPTLMHTEYILSAFAFILKDILWLRIFAIIASIANIIYNGYLMEEPSWIDVYWSYVFIGINATHSFILLKAMWDVNLTEKEREIYASVFNALKIVDFHQLVRMAKLRKMKKGSILVEQNQPLQHLYLLYSGSARVVRSGQELTILKPYAFVGEIAYTTDRPATATVEFSEDSEVYIWSFEKLEKLMSSNTSMKVAFQLSIGTDMAKKLGSSSEPEAKKEEK